MLKKNTLKTHIIKNKGLRRVCAVVCLCFGMFVVAKPFTRSIGNLKVSAAATTVNIPENSYIISVSRSPAFYVSWANINSISTLTITPVLYISKSGYYVSFGASLYKLPIAVGSVGGNTAPSNSVYIESPFYRTVQSGTPVTPSVDDKFGFSGFMNALSQDPELLYNKLITGDVVIQSVELMISCQNQGSTWTNYSEFTIVVTSPSGGSVNGSAFRFVRTDSSMPYPSNYTNYLYTSGQDEFFSYVVTYNGLSTSSQEYQAGYQAGQTEGYNRGYNIGNTAGQIEGYNRGFDVGVSQKLSDVTPWQIIVDGVNGFLNIEILPSVKLSVILSVSFGLILLGFAIKIFLGG